MIMAHDFNRSQADDIAKVLDEVHSLFKEMQKSNAGANVIDALDQLIVADRLKKNYRNDLFKINCTVKK